MDPTEIVSKFLLVAFLIGMNGFFVAAEFCCVRIRPTRLETLIQEGSSRAKYAKKLTDELDESLSVTQLGITLASLGLGWIGEPFVAKLIEPLINYRRGIQSPSQSPSPSSRRFISFSAN